MECLTTAVSPRNTLSVVVPVYNEDAVLEAFHQRLRAVLDSLDCAAEIIYVNDGSTDGSLTALTELPSIRCPRGADQSFP